MKKYNDINEYQRSLKEETVGIWTAKRLERSEKLASNEIKNTMDKLLKKESSDIVIQAVMHTLFDIIVCAYYDQKEREKTIQKFMKIFRETNVELNKIEILEDVKERLVENIAKAFAYNLQVVTELSIVAHYEQQLKDSKEMF